MVNGKQKGCKKILVLYTNFGKNRKPEKTNWVMHQYHLGQHEEEKEGELVVSKIFYQTQPRQCNWSDRTNAATAVDGTTNVVVVDPNNSRRDSGIRSCSSKEQLIPLRDEVSGAGIAAAALSSFAAAMDIQHLKSDHHLSFTPFSKSFDQVLFCSFIYNVFSPLLQLPKNFNLNRQLTTKSRQDNDVCVL